MFVSCVCMCACACACAFVCARVVCAVCVCAFVCVGDMEMVRQTRPQSDTHTLSLAKHTHTLSLACSFLQGRYTTLATNKLWSRVVSFCRQGTGGFMEVRLPQRVQTQTQTQVQTQLFLLLLILPLLSLSLLFVVAVGT